MSTEKPSPDQVVYCSFCGRGNNDFSVKAIVDGGDSKICSVCIAISAEIVNKFIHAEWLKLKDFAP